MNRLVIYGLMALVATVAGWPLAASAGPKVNPSPLKVSSGTLQTMTIASPEMGREVTVDIWTPPGYDAKNRRYPVLYMHDGQNLFDAASTWNKQAWEMDSVAGTLIEAGEMEPIIIVGVYCVPETRVGDMMPAEPLQSIAADSIRAMVSARLTSPVKGDKYVDFIAGTLKPVIDELFPTRSEAAATAVMGSSMGGLASVYAICRHPETFGAAACLSTHWTGFSQRNEVFPAAMAGYMLSHLPSGKTHKLYFDSGTEDIDELYIPYFHRIAGMVGQLGYAPHNLLVRFFPGQGHQERYWKTRVAEPLLFLFGK